MAFLILIPQTLSITAEIKISQYQTLIDNSSFNNHPKLETLPTYGSSSKLFYYYTYLYIREEMQKQKLYNKYRWRHYNISSLCKNCGKYILPNYDVNSKDEMVSCFDEKCSMVRSCLCSNSLNNCSFDISFSEHSKISGIYINKLIRFGENYKSQKGIFIPIGCSLYETKLIYKQNENGILGLPNSDKNFVELLYKYGAIKNNIYLVYASPNLEDFLK